MLYECPDNIIVDSALYIPSGLANTGAATYLWWYFLWISFKISLVFGFIVAQQTCIVSYFRLL